ncbi:hypothetical protein J6590_022387 [Homalodisca vitripennis]|nr:hypothetical protein J6590_022387 [Homalodisca vitripennis]
MIAAYTRRHNRPSPISTRQCRDTMLTRTDGVATHPRRLRASTPPHSRGDRHPRPLGGGERHVHNNSLINKDTLPLLRMAHYDHRCSLSSSGVLAEKWLRTRDIPCYAGDA